MADAETRNRIYQWNNTYNNNKDPLDPNDDYLEIVQATKTVTIVAGISGKTFEFEAREEEDMGGEWLDVGPGDINLLEANVNAGTVSVTVVGHNEHTYGALNIEELKLGASGVSSTIEELEIRGNLGDQDQMNVGAVAGSFHAKHIVQELHVDNTIEQGGTISADFLEAELHVDGTGPHQGNIDVGNFDYPCVIDVTGTMEGSITVGPVG